MQLKLWPFFSHTASYRFLLFAIMLFFLFFADAIMTYYVPVAIEGAVGSSTKMGLVLATSSLVGMVIDFSFAQFFSQKKALFFQLILFLCVFFFPLSFFLSHSVLTFVLAMAWWGVSYEAMTFTTYHAIHEAVGRSAHAWAWGIVAILKNVSLVIGPLIASSALAYSLAFPLSIAIFCNAIAALIFFALYLLNSHRLFAQNSQELTPTPARRTLSETIAIWKALDQILWPLLAFLALFFLFDSAVFTIGPILTERLKQQQELGGVFVSLYGIPGIFVGFFLSGVGKRFGKKKAAFVSGILGGFCAVLIGVSHVLLFMLIAMFFASLWLSVMEPLLLAVFEDLVARGESVANDLISFTALTSSFGYVVGPVLNGVMADLWGELSVFMIWGALLCGFGVWLLLTFPRKVRLPQAQIQHILSQES